MKAFAGINITASHNRKEDNGYKIYLKDGAQFSPPEDKVVIDLVNSITDEEILKLKEFRPLVKQDLLNAVDKIRGTLSKKVRDELQKWNEQFGGV